MAMLDEYVPDPRERRWLEPRLAGLLGLVDLPAGDSGELFSAFRTLFERVAERGTTVLVFEDLHLADAGLLDFIEGIPEWSRDHPILVVTLARPEILDRRPGWGPGRAQLPPRPPRPRSPSGHARGWWRTWPRGLPAGGRAGPGGGRRGAPLRGRTGAHAHRRRPPGRGGRPLPPGRRPGGPGRTRVAARSDRGPAGPARPGHPQPGRRRGRARARPSPWRPWPPSPAASRTPSQGPLAELTRRELLEVHRDPDSPGTGAATASCSP